MDLLLADKALSKAKIALMTLPDTVFFCELAFSLKYEWDDTMPTACTNGVYMKLNPEWFMALTQPQQIGLILHETMHTVYMHMLRRGHRDHRRYNIAGDHVINLMLLERRFQLPPDGYHDPAFKGMTTEAVYDLLPTDPDPDFTPDVVEGDCVESPQEIEQQVQQTLIRAALRSEQEGDTPGTVPGDIKLFLDGLLNPKLPWNKILIQYLNRYTKSDYSWRRPNRRFMPEFYLPSLHSTSLIDLAIAVDISGSVTDYEFKTFISEIAAIFRMLKPEKITLIQFDTAIKSVDSIKGFNDLVNVSFTGRGGTDFEPVLQWAQTKSNTPQLLLVFTDGAFRFRTQTYKGDVLWLIHNDKKKRFNPPYGKTIHYEVKT